MSAIPDADAFLSHARDASACAHDRSVELAAVIVAALIAAGMSPHEFKNLAHACIQEAD